MKLDELVVERWPDSDLNATQGFTSTAGGRLLIAPRAGSWGAAYSAYLQTVDSWDLTGSAFVLELVAPAANGNTQTTQTRIELHTGTPHGRSLLFEVTPGTGGQIRAGYRFAAGQLAQWVAVRPYTALAHRWLRISERDGFVRWDASPDGFDWSELGAWPSTIDVSALKVRLEAGFWGPPEGEVGFLPLAPATFGPINPAMTLPGDPLTAIVGDGSAPNLAIDVQPGAQLGTFIVGDSLVDGPELLGWGTGALGWVNVVCDVNRVRVQRGATRVQGVLTRTEAGSAQIELVDTARRFDPTVNADAIHPGTRFRVRAWGAGWSEVLMTGRIDGDFDVTYRKSDAPLVTFTAVDVVSPLARYSAAGRPDPGVGAGDNLHGRIVRVLAETGQSAALAYDSDLAYRASHLATTLARGWAVINDATDAELGRVWVTRHDRIVARARGSQMSGPVRGTLSDWHGEAVEGTVHCCYSDAAVRFGTELLTNRAVAARRTVSGAPASSVVQVDDAVSQARYSSITSTENRSLDLEFDGQLAPWAQHLVGKSSTPELRVERVVLSPAGAPEAWPAVAATDIGDRWAFRLHPDLGPTVMRTLGVIGLEHEITPTSWEVTLTTVDAPTPTEGNPSGWFILGDSEVGSGDVLFPQGAVPEWVPFGV